MDTGGAGASSGRTGPGPVWQGGHMPGVLRYGPAGDTGGAVLGQHVLHRAVELDLRQLLSRFLGLGVVLGFQVVQLLFQLVSIGRFLRQFVDLRDLCSQCVLRRFRRRLVRLDFCMQSVQQLGYYFIRGAFAQNVLDLFAFHVFILLYDFITVFSHQDSALYVRRRK